MWDYHGGDNQLWYWDPNEVAIRSKKYPNKVIDLHMADFNRHGWGKIYLHEWNEGSNQKWRLEGDRLISHFKNLHLDIYGGKRENGTGVGGYPNKAQNGHNQKWMLSTDLKFDNHFYGVAHPKTMMSPE